MAWQKLELYAKHAKGVDSSQDSGCSKTKQRNISTNERLNRSAKPLICGLKLVVYFCEIPKDLTASLKSFPVNSRPQSEYRISGHPRTENTSLTIALATVNIFLSGRGTLRANLLKESITVNIYLLPFLDSGKGPIRSIWTRDQTVVTSGCSKIGILGKKYTLFCLQIWQFSQYCFVSLVKNLHHANVLRCSVILLKPPCPVLMWAFF